MWGKGFCFVYKDGEMTTCFYAHNKNPVESEKANDENKKGKIARVLPLNRHEKGRNCTNGGFGFS